MNRAPGLLAREIRNLIKTMLDEHTVRPFFGTIGVLGPPITVTIDGEPGSLNVSVCAYTAAAGDRVYGNRWKKQTIVICKT